MTSARILPAVLLTSLFTAAFFGPQFGLSVWLYYLVKLFKRIFE